MKIAKRLERGACEMSDREEKDEFRVRKYMKEKGRFSYEMIERAVLFGY